MSSLSPKIEQPTLVSSLAKAPIWWLAGFDFFVYLLVGIWSGITSSRRLPGWTWNESALLAVPATLTLSLLAAILFKGEASSRAISALYNILVWVSGYGIVRYLRSHLQASSSLLISILNSAKIPSIFLIALLSIGTIAGVWLPNGISWPTLLGIFTPTKLPGLISTSQLALVTRPDFIMGLTIPRGTAMSPYPNAAAVSLIILTAWTYLAIMRQKNSTLRFAKITFLLAGGFIALISTGSRSALFGVILASILVGLVQKRPIWRLTAFVILIGVATLGLALGSTVSDVRDNSSATRFGNYSLAFDTVTSIDPVLGLGVKPDWGEDIPLGSHSTIISSFTKGGTIGLLAVVMAILVLPIRDLWKAKEALQRTDESASARRLVRVLFIIQFTVVFWVLLEDLDAPPLASYLIFVHLGLLQMASHMIRHSVLEDRPLVPLER